jgi:hypothetical protein
MKRKSNQIYSRESSLTMYNLTMIHYLLKRREERPRNNKYIRKTNKNNKNKKLK